MARRPRAALNKRPPAQTPTSAALTQPAVLPLGALLLAGSMSAMAQTPHTPVGGTLHTVTVTELAEPGEIKA